jgi:hypothetical protein
VLGVHAVEVLDAVLVAEGLHGHEPGFEHDPFGGVHDVLSDDGPVVVDFGEAGHVPHGGAGPVGGLVGEGVAEQVSWLVTRFRPLATEWLVHSGEAQRMSLLPM